MFFYYKTVIAMEFKSNICPRYERAIKSISNLTKYINVFKILFILLFYLFLKLK